jgi:hypothetical protein
MFVRRAAFCGVIAVAAIGLLAFDNTAYAADQKAIEDYLAAARAFLAEFDGMADNPDLPVLARGLVRSCGELPVAQLPHVALKYCADFEEFWQHEWPRKRYLQQQLRK